MYRAKTEGTLGLGTHLFVKRYLDQETEKRPFQSSSQAATCYYQSNQLKGETIPLSTFPRIRIQQAKLPAYLQTICFLYWTSNREAVNANFQSLLVRLGQGIEPWSTDYETNAVTSSPHAGLAIQSQHRKEIKLVTTRRRTHFL